MVSGQRVALPCEVGPTLWVPNKVPSVPLCERLGLQGLHSPAIYRV